MTELEYKRRYKGRLIDFWKIDPALAYELAQAAEFDPSDPSPEDHADDCVSYMAQDS